MEYPVHWGIVFSDVVVRSAQALKQYRVIAPSWPESQRFEATLTLSVAQTILAATKELQDALGRLQPDVAQDMATDLAGVFQRVELLESTWLAGASGDGFVTRGDLTGAGILEHLRNASSHPVPGPPRLPMLPMTGYATVPRDGRIWGVRFTHSPWVQHDEETGGRVVNHGRNVRRIDPQRRLQSIQQNGRTVLVLPGRTTAYYPLVSLQVTIEDLSRICDDLSDNFERWQKELTGGREQSPATVSQARSQPLS